MCPGSGVKHTETESKAWGAVGGWEEEAAEEPKSPNWPFLLWPAALPLFVCSDTGAATRLAGAAKQQAQQSQLAGSWMVAGGSAGKRQYAKGSAGNLAAKRQEASADNVTGKRQKVESAMGLAGTLHPT